MIAGYEVFEVEEIEAPEIDTSSHDSRHDDDINLASDWCESLSFSVSDLTYLT